MTEIGTWSLTIRRNYRLLKQWTCLTYVVQQCSLYRYFLIKTLVISHNTSYISNILEMLIQTDASVLLTLGQYFLMDIHMDSTITAKIAR